MNWSFHWNEAIRLVKRLIHRRWVKIFRCQLVKNKTYSWSGGDNPIYLQPLYAGLTPTYGLLKPYRRVVHLNTPIPLNILGIPPTFHLQKIGEVVWSSLRRSIFQDRKIRDRRFEVEGLGIKWLYRLDNDHWIYLVWAFQFLPELGYFICGLWHCELELQHPLPLRPFPDPFMLSLIFGFYIMDDLLKFWFIIDFYNCASVMYCKIYSFD